MSRPCEWCDEPAEFVEITGDVARPTGSIYRCENGHEFTVSSGARGDRP
jgi:hypothetical protein